MQTERIAVITYDVPHRKTQDVVFGLKAKGYKDVKLFALPFVKRENPFVPIFQHRPSDCWQISVENFCQNMGYEFQKVNVADLHAALTSFEPNATLIAGAGLLPESLVNSLPIINSHPAYLPLVRGLDALKWAIHKKMPIGVTTHLVDAQADAGFLIDRVEVPVYQNDTFHSLAYRQYTTEIQMLIEAIPLLKSASRSPLEAQGEAHRRMPKRIEAKLLQDFQEYLQKFAVE